MLRVLLGLLQVQTAPALRRQSLGVLRQRSARRLQRRHWPAAAKSLAGNSQAEGREEEEAEEAITGTTTGTTTDTTMGREASSAASLPAPCRSGVVLPQSP